ncbi:MAG: hypothetical protein AAB425_14635, partial [Bdellovibrionota bacterium]
MAPIAYKKIQSPLVIDPEADFISAMTKDPAAAEIAPTIASSGAEALLALDNAGNTLSAIFINPAIQNPTWVEVLKRAIRSRPGVPIYLISERELS